MDCVLLLFLKLHCHMTTTPMSSLSFSRRIFLDGKFLLTFSDPPDPTIATLFISACHTVPHVIIMTSMGHLLAFKLAPPSQGGSRDSLFNCDEEIERRYEVVPSVVCSMCCLFGIIYCFFGRWCGMLSEQDDCVLYSLLCTETTKFLVCTLI